MKIINLIIKISRVLHRIVIKQKFRLSKSEKKYYFDRIFSFWINYHYYRVCTYDNWLKDTKLSNRELKLQRNYHFDINPLLSIIAIIQKPDIKFILQLLKSLEAQTYSSWELFFICKEIDVDAFKTLFKISKNNQKIKLIKDGASLNIKNKLIFSGDFITFCGENDLYPPDAFYEYVNCINNNPEADLIYSDEDQINEINLKRQNPAFKPDWSPDTLRSFNYIGNSFIISKKLFGKVWNLNLINFNESSIYDLILRATEKSKKIIHIPKILYHKRSNHLFSDKNNNDESINIESMIKSLDNHLKRLNLTGHPIHHKKPDYFKIKYELKEHPLVSIVIPNKDHKDDLKKCLDSIITKSIYKNYEIIIVENNSKSKEIFNYYAELKKFKKIKVIYWESKLNEFNYSAINNYSLRYVNGKYIIFLNNDTEIITESWIEEMMEYAQRDDVGIVGAMLYYPDDTIQHAGVMVGVGIHGTADHSHKNFKRGDTGYHGRMVCVYNLSAVTAACMMIKTDLFKSVGGFDENLKVILNDIDLCLKVRENDKLVVFTPFAELYHNEFKSRGQNDTIEKLDREINENELFKKRWIKILKDGDPYYNPNLTLTRCDFSCKWMRRK